MPWPAFELADIFRLYGAAAEKCSQCDYTRIAYNSCLMGSFL
jgi:hypothetical protein